jgi:hypothetical protein
MRSLLFILFSFASGALIAQDVQVVKRMKEFHQVLISREGELDDYIHKQLSYGHSNGWIETATELKNNLESGYMKYYSFREDSITVQSDKKVAQVRFVGEIDVSRGTTRATYRLRILEIWIKKGKDWFLFARQALRA